MLAKKYHSRVKSFQNPIDGIYTVEFESLDGRYKYNPGQFLHLALDQEYDGSGQWPESRCFSMQSNPDEETLKITFSVKGKFTLSMKEQLKTGTTVWLKLPYGNLFSQEHSKVNTVFIAGGTGITPFLSLFTSPALIEYEKPVLYAGFRNKETNLYIKQLEKALEINPGLKVNVVYQNTDGLLDIKQIFEDSYRQSSFYISGPPQMIKVFKDHLISYGLAPEQIKTDDWE